MTPSISPVLRRATVGAITSLLIGGAVAGATATPVGPLPAGPTVRIVAPRGTTVALALPTQKAASGLVWRIARPFDDQVAREVSEGEVGASTLVLVKLVGRGTTTIRFALTRGDVGTVAKASRSFRVESR